MTHLATPHLRTQPHPTELYSLCGNIRSFLNADFASHAGQCCCGKSIRVRVRSFAVVHAVGDTLAIRFGGAR